MASIRHVGGNRWQVTVFAGRDSAGRQRRVSKTFEASGEREAKRKAPAIEVQIRMSGRVVDTEDRTVGWLVDEWLEHKASTPGGSPTTLASARGMGAEIKRELGKVRLDRLTPTMIEQFYAHLRRRRKRDKTLISESTVHHYHRILRSIIRQGHRWGFIERSVIERVTAPSPRTKRVAIPTDDAVTRLLDAAPGELAVLLRVYAATGARRSEVLALRWGDLEGDVLSFQRTVYEAKGRGVLVKDSLKNPNETVRRVVLDPATLQVVEAYRGRLMQVIRDTGCRWGDSVWMFPNLRVDASGRTPQRPNTVSHQFADLCDTVGVKMRLHDLRHWHASQLLNAGIPIMAVSERLGHSQVSTTMNIYAHSDVGRDRMAAEAIGRVLSGVPPQGLEP